ncbi:MAG: hypothetical protein KKC20_06790 [Proteobacteria bacterium]|nr:hypothetical protein [Pseudomonadota bacterium]
MVERSKRDKAPPRSGRIWPDWYPRLNSFRISNPGKSTWQLINTLIPYTCLWGMMIWMIQHIFRVCSRGIVQKETGLK